MFIDWKLFLNWTKLSHRYNRVREVYRGLLKRPFCRIFPKSIRLRPITNIQHRVVWIKFQFIIFLALMQCVLLKVQTQSEFGICGSSSFMWSPYKHFSRAMLHSENFFCKKCIGILKIFALLHRKWSSLDVLWVALQILHPEFHYY